MAQGSSRPVPLWPPQAAREAQVISIMSLLVHDDVVVLSSVPQYARMLRTSRDPIVKLFTDGKSASGTVEQS